MYSLFKTTVALYLAIFSFANGQTCSTTFTNVGCYIFDPVTVASIGVPLVTLADPGFLLDEASEIGATLTTVAPFTLENCFEACGAAAYIAVVPDANGGSPSCVCMESFPSTSQATLASNAALIDIDAASCNTVCSETDPEICGRENYPIPSGFTITVPDTGAGIRLTSVYQVNLCPATAPATVACSALQNVGCYLGQSLGTVGSLALPLGLPDVLQTNGLIVASYTDATAVSSPQACAAACGATTGYITLLAEPATCICTNQLPDTGVLQGLGADLGIADLCANACVATSGLCAGVNLDLFGIPFADVQLANVFSVNAGAVSASGCINSTIAASTQITPSVSTTGVSTSVFINSTVLPSPSMTQAPTSSGVITSSSNSSVTSTISPAVNISSSIPSCADVTNVGCFLASTNDLNLLEGNFLLGSINYQVLPNESPEDCAVQCPDANYVLMVPGTCYCLSGLDPLGAQLQLNNVLGLGLDLENLCATQCAGNSAEVCGSLTVNIAILGVTADLASVYSVARSPTFCSTNTTSSSLSSTISPNLSSSSSASSSVSTLSSSQSALANSSTSTQSSSASSTVSTQSTSLESSSGSTSSGSTSSGSTSSGSSQSSSASSSVSISSSSQSTFANSSTITQSSSASSTTPTQSTSLESSSGSTSLGSTSGPTSSGSSQSSSASSSVSISSSSQSTFANSSTITQSSSASSTTPTQSTSLESSSGSSQSSSTSSSSTALSSSQSTSVNSSATILPSSQSLSAGSTAPTQFTTSGASSISQSLAASSNASQSSVQTLASSSASQSVPQSSLASNNSVIQSTSPYSSTSSIVSSSATASNSSQPSTITSNSSVLTATSALSSTSATSLCVPSLTPACPGNGILPAFVRLLVTSVEDCDSQHSGYFGLNPPGTQDTLNVALTVKSSALIWEYIGGNQFSVSEPSSTGLGTFSASDLGSPSQGILPIFFATEAAIELSLAVALTVNINLDCSISFAYPGGIVQRGKRQLASIDESFLFVCRGSSFNETFFYLGNSATAPNGCNQVILSYELATPMYPVANVSSTAPTSSLASTATQSTGVLESFTSLYTPTYDPHQSEPPNPFSTGEPNYSSSSYTTSVVYVTTVYTISKCPVWVTDCPYGHLTTSTISSYTTVCPVEATTTGEPYNSYSSYTTSVVYVTTVYTISKCPVWVTDCPYGQLTTSTLSLYTTVCPVEATTTGYGFEGGLEGSSGQPVGGSGHPAASSGEPTGGSSYSEGSSSYPKGGSVYPEDSPEATSGYSAGSSGYPAGGSVNSAGGSGEVSGGSESPESVSSYPEGESTSSAGDHGQASGEGVSAPLAGISSEASGGSENPEGGSSYPGEAAVPSQLGGPAVPYALYNQTYAVGASSTHASHAATHSTEPTGAYVIQSSAIKNRIWIVGFVLGLLLVVIVP